MSLPVKGGMDDHTGFEADDDDEDDREADCGRWDNGRLMAQCRLAGSEWCDWQCKIWLRDRAS